jgi:hypothetical protein
LLASGRKSSKSAALLTGKIIPLRIGVTIGTQWQPIPLTLQNECGGTEMYIGLGGLLILILVLWLLGVI